MKKAEVIKELDELYLSMKPYMKWINGKIIKLYKELRKREDYHEMQSTLKWLKEVNIKEFNQLMYAWNLCTPERWAYYDMMQFKGLTEQGILDKAKKEFQQVWNKQFLGEENGNMAASNSSSDQRSNQLANESK